MTCSPTRRPRPRPQLLPARRRERASACPARRWATARVGQAVLRRPAGQQQAVAEVPRKSPASASTSAATPAIRRRRRAAPAGPSPPALVSTTIPAVEDLRRERVVDGHARPVQRGAPEAVPVVGIQRHEVRSASGGHRRHDVARVAGVVRRPPRADLHAPPGLQGRVVEHGEVGVVAGPHADALRVGATPGPTARSGTRPPPRPSRTVPAARRARDQRVPVLVRPLRALLGVQERRARLRAADLGDVLAAAGQQPGHHHRSDAPQHQRPRHDPDHPGPSAHAVSVGRPASGCAARACWDWTGTRLDVGLAARRAPPAGRDAERRPPLVEPPPARTSELFRPRPMKRTDKGLGHGTQRFAFDPPPGVRRRAGTGREPPDGWAPGPGSGPRKSQAPRACAARPPRPPGAGADQVLLAVRAHRCRDRGSSMRSQRR